MIPSVMIAIPTGRGGWSADFCMSLIDVVTRPIAAALGYETEPAVSWRYERSSAIVQNRHNLVRHAQQAGVSHILFLDDDMTFPADTLERLLRAGRPIVAANCPTRSIPIVPTAVKNDRRIVSMGKTGLELVNQVGLAVMLIDMKVFARIDLPWFSFAWDRQYPDTYCSEDMYFCKKARASGIGVWVDHLLSQEIGHVGEIEYRHEMIDEAEVAALNDAAAPSQHIQVA